MMPRLVTGRLASPRRFAELPWSFAKFGQFPKGQTPANRPPYWRMPDSRAAVETVFREESGRIIASLIRFSGSFDLAEEAMQDALARALAVWPAEGIPENPA